MKFKIRKNTFRVPNGYEPYHLVNFCGNLLSDVTYLIEDDGFCPVLIGKGIVPRIWLYSKEFDGSYIALILDSKPQNKNIRITSSEHKLEVIFDDGLFRLKPLELQFSHDRIIITKIDLQISNYRIFGDNEKLEVGETIIKGNTITVARTFIAIGIAEK